MPKDDATFSLIGFAFPFPTLWTRQSGPRPSPLSDQIVDRFRPPSPKLSRQLAVPRKPIFVNEAGHDNVVAGAIVLSH